MTNMSSTQIDSYFNSITTDILQKYQCGNLNFLCINTLSDGYIFVKIQILICEDMFTLDKDITSDVYITTQKGDYVKLNESNEGEYVRYNDNALMMNELNKIITHIFKTFFHDKSEINIDENINLSIDKYFLMDTSFSKEREMEYRDRLNKLLEYDKTN